MNRSGQRNFARVIILGAAIAALGLVGCGRKGGLDAPPSGAAVPQSQERQSARPSGLSPIGSGSSDPVDQRAVTGERAGMSGDGRAVAPVGEKRHIPLDVLID